MDVDVDVEGGFAGVRGTLPPGSVRGRVGRRQLKRSTETIHPPTVGRPPGLGFPGQSQQGRARADSRRGSQWEMDCAELEARLPVCVGVSRMVARFELDVKETGTGE